jgi:peptide/nickel transport system ATP-binding protein
MAHLLEVKNLSVSFSIQGRKLHAVRGISFHLKEREALGIVGESGSGKSAAVQSLTRISPAHIEGGEVLLDGIDLLTLSPKHLRKIRGREIGMVFQDPMTSLNPTMKIGAQVLETLLFHRLAKAKEAKLQGLELLHLVGIPEPELRFSQYPHQLSGGMRQRASIAIALAAKARILIADEPTTALDPTIQAQILELLKRLARVRKMSQIIITHDIGVIASLCDRVLVMYGGQIVEEGTIDEVLGSPRHPYTRMLLQSKPSRDISHEQKLISIEGSPPNHFSSPSGCSFAPRCPYAMKICITTPPPVVNGNACWLESLERVPSVSMNLPSLVLPRPSHPQKPPLIRVENLSKTFTLSKGKKCLAVRNVSFRIHPGETLGLVGESGCGKSTLGRTILKLYEPTQGRIFLEDKEITHWSEREMKSARREMQMIFQDPFTSLNPRMTVGDILMEPLEVHGLPHQNRLFDLLDLVNLPKTSISRFPHEFSGGQRQRIGIARAIALNPKFIVCDEPISALDVSIQAQIANLLMELQRELGLTYLFIAHDLTMVKYLSSHVAVMYLGELIESGSREEIYRRPLHPYTQILLSSIPLEDPKEERKRTPVVLHGEVPSPFNPPKGCAFCTRCPKAQPICFEEKPELKEMRPGHSAACFFAEA